MGKRVVFEEEKCKGCGLCINACPRQIISFKTTLNEKGYRPAGVSDQDTCISCAACARICPDSVISVYRPLRKKAAVS